MKLLKIVLTLCFFFLLIGVNAENPKSKNALQSFDIGLTITKVRTAEKKNKAYIVASSYEGIVVGVSLEGKVLWKNKLSGFMNHDISCQDLDGDGIDEILVANADGKLYCLDSKGKNRWVFTTSYKNTPPMYAVTVVKNNGESIVVCGGFDKSFYYVSAEGKLLNEIKSATYSNLKPWGKGKGHMPPKNTHTINFLRTIKQKDGSEVLLVHGSHNHMQSRGAFYFFKHLALKPYFSKILSKKDIPVSVGELKVVDANNDGNPEILLGTSAHTKNTAVSVYDIATDKMTMLRTSKRPINLGFGYRVAQPEVLKKGNEFEYVSFIGSHVLISPPSLNPKKTEIVQGKYSYNDMWKMPGCNKVILASSQSGGSCIHILDFDNSKWKKAYKNFTPVGKISQILKNTDEVRSNMKKFKKPSYERNPLPVYLMTEKYSTELARKVAQDIRKNYQSPLFMNQPKTNKENWDRSTLQNEYFRKKRDKRMKYNRSQQQVLDKILPKFDGAPGVAYWGGHGNDPYMFSLSTTKKVIEGAKGKKTILIYPEMGNHSGEFGFALDNLFYPMAAYAQGKNATIFVRSKNIFWQGDVYEPIWSRLISGEFADVFVPSMEETTDKTMELSVSGRLGLWASGAVNGWGTRGARDNTSFDRSRQHSHQMLPNHFLRTMVYHISSGAQYINNFGVDQDHMSVLWELIAKGVLYVPKPSEIVSFSPVHLSMKEPHLDYMKEGVDVKWTTYFDDEKEEREPMVFSRMNGSWMGAPVKEWDFSKYAAGVNDRRLNFLPNYSNGMVLITPPQEGVFAQKNPSRGKMEKHLHPLYKNILQEFITDGKSYFSADGKQTFKANEYHTKIANAIQEGAKKIPITVSGDVAWVVSQTSPKHLRLTLVDDGYINPKNSTALVKFNTINPVQVKDLLSGEKFKVKKSQTTIEIPLGSFRFIDVELSESL